MLKVSQEQMSTNLVHICVHNSLLEQTVIHWPFFQSRQGGADAIAQKLDTRTSPWVQLCQLVFQEEAFKWEQNRKSKMGSKQKRDLLGHDMPDFQDVMTKARSGHSSPGNSFCPSTRICKMLLKGWTSSTDLSILQKKGTFFKNLDLFELY